MSYVIKVRAHRYETTELAYDQFDLAVRSIETAAVDRATAIRLVHGELFAYIGNHPSTGQRFGVWRTSRPVEISSV